MLPTGETQRGLYRRAVYRVTRRQGRPSRERLPGL